MKKIIKGILRQIKRTYYRYKYGLKNISKTCLVCKGCKVSKDLEAKEYTFVGPNCIIYPKVKIGKYSMLANDVQIIGADHAFNNPSLPMTFSGREEIKPTEIGEDCWIGARCTILVGVKIGDGAIIGTGSVVTKDIEPYSINAGIPAKKIKMRFTEEEIAIHKEMLRKKFSFIEASKLACDRIKDF